MNESIGYVVGGGLKEGLRVRMTVSVFVEQAVSLLTDVRRHDVLKC